MRSGLIALKPALEVGDAGVEAEGNHGALSPSPALQSGVCVQKEHAIRADRRWLDRCNPHSVRPPGGLMQAQNLNMAPKCQKCSLPVSEAFPGFAGLQRCRAICFVLI